MKITFNNVLGVIRVCEIVSELFRGSALCKGTFSVHIVLCYILVLILAVLRGHGG
jgi:hypothetical protein